jgi:hypothetical protein
MKDYNFNNNGWKDDVGSAVVRFLAYITACVPWVAAVIAIAFFLHTLFTEPFGFTCKSLPVDRPTTVPYRKVIPIRVIPMAKPKADVAPVTVELVKPDTDKDQDSNQE